MARIILEAPLETGSCKRQPKVSCPLVIYGRLCAQPVLQVSLRHYDSAEERYQDHQVSPHCTEGGTAEEQNLLLASHLTYAIQPGLITVILHQDGTNMHLPHPTSTSYRGSTTVKLAIECPSNWLSSDLLGALTKNCYALGSHFEEMRP